MNIFSISFEEVDCIVGALIKQYQCNGTPLLVGGIHYGGKSTFSKVLKKTHLRVIDMDDLWKEAGLFSNSLNGGWKTNHPRHREYKERSSEAIRINRTKLNQAHLIVGHHFFGYGLHKDVPDILLLAEPGDGITRRVRSDNGSHKGDRLTGSLHLMREYAGKATGGFQWLPSGKRYEAIATNVIKENSQSKWLTYLYHYAALRSTIIRSYPEVCIVPSASICAEKISIVCACLTDTH